MLLAELFTLLFLSSVITSPSIFGYLSVVYILFKIARRWSLRGCLPGGGGGQLEDGGGFDSSDHPDEGGKSRACANSRAGLPVIKLIPLGEEVSARLARVMADDESLQKTQDIPDGDNNTTTMDESMTMQPPKLKKKYQKQERQEEEGQEVVFDGDNGGPSLLSQRLDALRADMMNDLDSLPPDNDTKYDESMEVEYNNNNDVSMELDESMDIDHPNTTKNDQEEESSTKDAISTLIENSLSNYSLDCYPYTFSPLLLFTQSSYFDKGYSNYNAVAAFFAPALLGLGVVSAVEDGNGADREEENVGDGGRSRGTRRRRRSGGGGGGSGNNGNSDRGNSSGDNGEKKNGGSAREGENNGNKDGDAGNVLDESMADGDDEPMVEEGDREGGQEAEYGINMLDNVIYESKNMTYDVLFTHIATTEALVTCCIEAHFTAFQMLKEPPNDSSFFSSGRGSGGPILLYYDPLNPYLMVARGDHDVQRAALYLLMKCRYGDNGHLEGNKKYYTESGSLHRQV